MKKMFMISHAAALLMMASLPLAGAAVNQVSHTATYDISRIGLGTDTVGGVTYTTVNYRGLYNVGTPGMPSLPVELIRFSVPYNATNFTVTATPSLSQSRLLVNPVYPYQSPNGFTQPDNGIYQIGETYPATAWFVDEGMMAGENHVVTVAVSPWTYQHTLGTAIADTLRMAESVGITLSYELTDSPALHALIRKGASLREKGYVRTSAMVVNPNDVRANAASAVTPPMIAYDPSYPELNDSVENPDTYLIITTPQLLNSMKRLAALKRQEGMRVKVVSLSEVLSDSIETYNVNPDYNPSMNYSLDGYGSLSQYLLMNYMDRGTEYVLLAGTDVPSYQGNDNGYSRLMKVFEYSTGNEYPAIKVGRILGNTTEQMNNYTDKLYRYELNPGRGDGSYINDALIFESLYMATYEGNSVDELGRIGMDVTAIHNFEPMLEYEELDTVTGCGVVNLVNNNHYGFMSALCYGAPNYLRVFDSDDLTNYNYLWAIDSIKVAPNVIDNSETGNGLNCFRNKDYPMLLFSCYGKTILYDSIQGYGTGPCFGESFTTGKDYGGPAFIGYSKDVVDYLAAVFYYHLFIDNIGSCDYSLCDATLSCRNSLYSLDEDKLSYLGDPALLMWTNTPQNYSGVGVTRAESGITVTGIPGNGTLIAYCDNNGNAGLLESSSSSVTINGVSPNSTVMLHKHNYLPYIAPLLIQNMTISNSQYVIADEVKMGKSVDSNRTPGAVTVSDGVEYEIEASGKVTLGAGFKVERGAFFATHKSCYK